MKRILITVWTLAFALALAVPSSSLAASAAKPDLEKHVLKPTQDTQKVFKKVTLATDGDTYHMSVKGYVKKSEMNQGAEGYHIDINPKKMKYKVTKIKEEKVKKFISKNDGSTKMSPSNLGFAPKSNVITPLYRSTASVKLKAVTDDPVGANLVSTIHTLTWDYNGTYAYFNSRDGRCNGGSSSFGTYWYVDSCYYSNYDRIDGGRTITTDGNGEYHNYDFQNNSKRTDVSHSIYMEGYGSGDLYYNVDWNASGEYSSLLDLDVYKYTG